jgi:hypothetical protein
VQHQKALDICLRDSKPGAGQFYGPANGLPLGSGLILKDCPVALPHPEEVRFRTALAFALVLTHECDVDPQNNRFFNDLVLVCPIITLEAFCESYKTSIGSDGLEQFLSSLASGNVFRAMYLPPPHKPQYTTHLQAGGIINLNWISSCRVSWLPDIKNNAICSLSEPGHRALDIKIHNHFFREKPTRLKLSQSFYR